MRDLYTLVAALFAIGIVACGGGSSGHHDGSPSTALHGVNFSAFVDGQDPTHGDAPSAAQIDRRLEVLVGRSRWIRTFGSTHGLELQACAARALGFSTAIGAWIAGDDAANQQEITGLLDAAHAGCVDVAIVGSEVLLRGDLEVARLTAYVGQVRSALAGSGIPVTTVERFQEWRAHSELIDAVDVVFANYYPFWDGVAVEDAVPVVHDWHSQLRMLAGAKEVVVAESGWPDAGAPTGGAVASPENAARYFLTFASWARAEQVDSFYFEAFDEAWKASQEGEVGAHWGIWSSDGVLKPHRQPVFDGATARDTWTAVLIDGPGTPTIELTSVARIGDANGFASGRVRHVVSSAYRVAVYIRVRGNWWTKPTFASPLTSIAPNGAWTADIVTGGVDAEADRVAAFLVPSSYLPPRCEGCGSLPPELAANAVASADVQREP